MIRALLMALPLLAACGLPLEGRDSPAPPPAARLQDPRCLPGGLWDDSVAACVYPDFRPPGPTR